MPDDYDMSGYQFPRRMRNIFPSPAQETYDPAQGFDPSGFNKQAMGGFRPFGSSYYPQQSIQQDNDYESDYTPSSTMKRYLDISQNAPKREDYQPTGWGRALAAAAGGLEGWKGGAGRGITAANAVRDMPYARALTDYDTERETAASALKAEQQESQLKSMAGYRSGTLTEKAKERERNRIMGISAAAATTQAGAAVTRAGAAVTAAEAAKTKAGKTNAPKPITPAAQASADKQAIDQVRRENPGKFDQFVDKKGVMKPPSSYLGFGPTVESAEYKKFRDEVEKRKKNILATGVAPVGDDGDVEEEVDY